MAAGLRIPAYLDADPRFRGCSLGTKFVYQQIARAGRIEQSPGRDIVGTLVFALRGLSDTPRADVESAIAECERAGLVTRDEAGIRTAHEPPPKMPDIPDDWDDTTRASCERVLRRVRSKGAAAMAAVIARFQVQANRRAGVSAEVSAGVSARASGQGSGTRPARTAEPVRPASGADIPVRPSPLSSLSDDSSKFPGEKRGEETSETSQVIARGGVRPVSAADSPDGQPADTEADSPAERRAPAGRPLTELTDDEAARVVVDLLHHQSERRLGWDFSREQARSLVGVLRRREFSLEHVRVLCACAREPDGLTILFPWDKARDVREKGRAPEAFLSARNWDPLCTAIDNAWSWDRRRARDRAAEVQRQRDLTPAARASPPEARPPPARAEPPQQIMGWAANVKANLRGGG